MPIIYAYRITREMCRKNPEMRFVFGDNVLKRGLGGQAKEMRGEPNTIGVATKREPATYDSSFFEDGNEDDRDELVYGLQRVENALADGATVVLPRDGIGTGRAEMATRCPQLFRFLQDELARMELTYGIGDASKIR